jgi:hypothetical protein
MHLKSLKIFALAFLAATSLANVAAADDAPQPAGKWRIEMSGGHATESGQVQFRITPHEGEPILVTARVGRGHGETIVAKDVLDALKHQLPKERFGAEIFSGQQVVVKPHRGEPDFTVELVESAVPGIRFHITPG